MDYCDPFHVKLILNFTNDYLLFTFSACNILVDSSTYVYTLRNYGQRINCSLLAMNPAKIQILSLTVGINSFEKKRYTETGTFHNVSELYNF